MPEVAVDAGRAGAVLTIDLAAFARQLSLFTR